MALSAAAAVPPSEEGVLSGAGDGASLGLRLRCGSFNQKASGTACPAAQLSSPSSAVPSFLPYHSPPASSTNTPRRTAASAPMTVPFHLEKMRSMSISGCAMRPTLVAAASTTTAALLAPSTSPAPLVSVPFPRKSPDDVSVEDLAKPKFRGKIHLLLTCLSPLWIGLLLQPCLTWTAYVASLISVFSSFTNFCASMLLHNFTWSPRWRVIMNKVDHAGIFMMISGSTTPIPMLLLGKWSSIFLMVVQWGATLYGVMTIWLGDLSCTARQRRALTYVIVGGLHTIFMGEYFRVLTSVEIQLVLLLAVFYVVGAVVYAYRWPDPFPKIFGFHELFHCFCLGSAICTFYLDYSILVRAGGGVAVEA